MRSFKKKKEKRLRGADWVLRRSKNKQVAFLIKAALKERVGGVGGRLRSKQAESFLYTHFLWSGHFGSEQQGEITCLVYAILHHSMRSHTQSIIHVPPWEHIQAHELIHVQSVCMHTRSHIYRNFIYEQWDTQQIYFNICTKRERNAFSRSGKIFFKFCYYSLLFMFF